MTLFTDNPFEKMMIQRPGGLYYAVIAGLRKDFENIRDRKLQLQNENNITLLHYENLIDVANEN